MVCEYRRPSKFPGSTHRNPTPHMSFRVKADEAKVTRRTQQALNIDDIDEVCLLALAVGLLFAAFVSSQLKNVDSSI